MSINETTFGNFTGALSAFRNAKYHHPPKPQPHSYSAPSHSPMSRGAGGGNAGPSSASSVFHTTTIPPQFWKTKELTINPTMLESGAAQTGLRPPQGAIARQSAENDTGKPSLTFDSTNHRFKELMFPSSAPTSRDEVLALANVMDTMLGEVDASALMEKQQKAAAPRSNSNSKSKQNGQAPTTSYNDAKRLIFENGTASVTMDAQGNEIEPPKEPFDHHHVRKVQSQITNVLMVGWMEVVRQTYTQCAERGVLLEKIRRSFGDILQNAYDITDFFEQKVDDIEALKLDEKIHMLYQKLEEKENEVRALHHHVGELNQEIESFDDEREELNRLRKREQFMQGFLTEQIERNAQLMQFGQVIMGEAGGPGSGAGGGSSGAGGGSSYPHSHGPGSHYSRRSRKSSVASHRTKAEGESTNGSIADGSEEGSQYQDSDEEWDDEESAGGEGFVAKTFADANCQVDMDRRHDELLYAELTNMSRHMQTVTEGTDKLAHKVYGQPDVANPSYHAALAIGKLEDISNRTLQGQQNSNAAHQKSNADGSIPARGDLEISKPLVISVCRDSSGALKQLALRITALLDHKGLQKALTDPMRPPRSLNEPCQLCKRLGMEPKMLSAVNELKDATTEIHKFKKENKKLTDEVREQKLQIEKLKNSLLNAAQAARKASLRRHSLAASENDPLSSPESNDNSTGENAHQEQQDLDRLQQMTSQILEENGLAGEMASTQTDISIPVDLDDGGGGGPLGGGRGTSPQQQSYDEFGNPISTPFDGSSPFDGQGSAGGFQSNRNSVMQLLSSNPSFGGGGPFGGGGDPLKLELVINCRCTTAGYNANGMPVGGAGQDGPMSPHAPSTITPSRSGRDIKRMSLRDLVTSATGTVAAPDGKGSATVVNPFSARKKDKALLEEKRRAELAVRVKRMKDMLILASDPGASPTSSKSLQWTLKQIAQIYKSKHQSDQTSLAEKHALLTCAEHFVDFFKQTYGTKKLVEDQTLHLLKGLQKHKEDLRVQQFSLFLEDNFSVSCYSAFVRVNKVIEDSIGMFDSVNTHTIDDETKFGRIGLECAIYAAAQVLKDEPEVFQNCAKGAIQLSAPSEKLYRSMTVADFEILAELEIPEDSNSRDLPRAHWLRHCCQIISQHEVEQEEKLAEEAAEKQRKQQERELGQHSDARRKQSVMFVSDPETIAQLKKAQNDANNAAAANTASPVPEGGYATPVFQSIGSIAIESSINLSTSSPPPASLLPASPSSAAGAGGGKGEPQRRTSTFRMSPVPPPLQAKQEGSGGGGQFVFHLRTSNEDATQRARSPRYTEDDREETPVNGATPRWNSTTDVANKPSTNPRTSSLTTTSSSAAASPRSVVGSSGEVLTGSVVARFASEHMVAETSPLPELAPE